MKNKKLSSNFSQLRAIMDAATIKFQQAITFAVLPVSDELAALHTARTRSHHPRSRSCPRCGTDLTTFGPRLVRLKRGADRPSRALSIKCHACGETALTPVDTGNASRYLSYRKSSHVLPSKHVVQSQASSSPDVPVTLSAPLPKKPSISNLEAMSQLHRAPKKKSGLQQMLQRNRERDQQRTQQEATKSTGLSAFLSTL